ncbi:Calreticulin/calnexin [Trinorchestia longiramus]|nr:Calreticulin/calnexin [Trinorchestia longiramus]
MYRPVLIFCLLAVSLVNAKVFFEERFSDGDAWESRWVQSKHSGKEFGAFKLSAGKFYGDAEASKGIQTPEDARFYGLSTKFEPFSNEEKPLVIQFSVKHEQNIDCGGGYLKVFDCSLDQKDMHGDSPYLIMFGPDICGPGTKRVHVIFSYKGQNHLIKKEIRCKDDVFSHLYTLIVNPDNTYEVKIDNEKVESGELEADWDFLPPKEIKDPDAKKPEDWDDRATIPDPDDTKPEDWDQPEHIADPDATKPEDWDDEMDGEWEPPMIDNPEYKGEWKPKPIDNPDFKGAWIHPMIENPEYSPDSSLYLRKEICAVGLDLWQVKSGTIFDNFLITNDIEEAKKIGEETWGAIKDAEKKMKDEQDEEERKKAEAEAKTAGDADEDDDEDEDDDDLDIDMGDDSEPDHDEL